MAAVHSTDEDISPCDYFVSVTFGAKMSFLMAKPAIYCGLSHFLHQNQWRASLFCHV